MAGVAQLEQFDEELYKVSGDVRAACRTHRLADSPAAL
jgi:hypothetical protein